MGNNNNFRTSVLEAAFCEFAAVLSIGLPQGQLSGSFSNADPSVSRKYDNLLLMDRIQAMEWQQGVGSTSTIAQSEIEHDATTPSTATIEKDQSKTTPSI
jgi:hypothetical protein